MPQIRVLWIAAGTCASPWPERSGLEQMAVCPVPSMPEAVARLERERFDAVVLCLPLPGESAESALAAVRRTDRAIPVLLEDPTVAPAEAVRLARLGFHQVLGEGEQARRHIEEAAALNGNCGAAAMPVAAERSPWERLLVGESPDLRQVVHIIRLVGPRRATVLITGETGTGKELAARALHMAGPRAPAPFVAVNCSALPENLLEAELFGHVRGAFTGAVQSRAGRFEQAHGGTLFLDEVGDLPLELQAKLLRVLQEREFQRLGSSETIRVDVRVVAATNCDLAAQIGQGRFREDLYYRLNVVPLPMPPLRRRRGDVPALAEHFIAKICAAENLPRKTLSSAAVAHLRAYSWPGNVRQLENAVEMAVALSGERTALDAADFPLPAAPRAHEPAPQVPFVPVPDTGLDFERTLTEIERNIVEQALRKTGGNKKAAAEMLRLKRTTLSAKVRTLAAGEPFRVASAEPA